MGTESIQTPAELEFVIFCVESVAARLGTDGESVYRALAEKSDLLRRYIVPSFEILHTQGKEYIVDDILAVMREEGVEV